MRCISLRRSQTSRVPQQRALAHRAVLDPVDSVEAAAFLAVEEAEAEAAAGSLTFGPSLDVLTGTSASDARQRA